MKTPDYSGQKILFTAFSVADGSEELAGYEFVKRHGATDITTLYWGDDEHAAQIPEDIKQIKIDGNDTFDGSLTEGYDLVFRHQTTRPDLIKSPTTTNTNEFFKYCVPPIVAVTGTKGKGTTSTLISLILDQAGVPNRLLGNMGNTAINELDNIGIDEIVIFEISSFQLWDLEHSPQVAVVLMMDVDHQDVHSSVDEYVAAKSNIVNHQSAADIVVYHPTNQMTAQVVGEPRGRSKRYMSDEGAQIVDDKIVIDGNEIMSVDDVGLRGKHNLENICAAITAAWEFTQDTNVIATAVAEFGGLEHRLEFVGEKNGIKFYNDSFSAVPVAASAAARAFDEPISMILGGYDKGSGFDEMAANIYDSTVERAVVIGDTRTSIANSLAEAGFENVHVYDGNEMAEIVNLAIEGMGENSNVILSPGCASFDMFKNYKDRGQQFKQAVKDL